MPAPVAFSASTDQGLVRQVNAFIKEPTLVQSVMAKLLDKQFIADAIFRDGGAAPSGVVQYWKDETLFMADNPAIYGEYAEIPAITGVDGTPVAAFASYFGGGLLISERMRTRNSIDVITKRMLQMRNTFVKSFDDMFMAAFFDPTSGIPTTAVPLSWNDTTAKIRYDLAKANEVVIGATDLNGNELIFEPDTLIVNPVTANRMTYNDDIGKVFRGNIASDAPIYRGDIGDANGYRILKSYRIPVNKGILLERKTVGFISDERSLRTTPMYALHGNSATGGPNETWRSDTTRASAVAVDQPKAAVILTGL